MAQQATSEELVALTVLFGRIASIAAATGGKATESSANLSIPGTMVASPRNEAALALVVEMPGSFRVDFAPTHPSPLEIPSHSGRYGRTGACARRTGSSTSGPMVGSALRLFCRTMRIASA